MPGIIVRLDIAVFDIYEKNSDNKNVVTATVITHVLVLFSSFFILNIIPFLLRSKIYIVMKE